jgi:hypothetical protein
VPPLALLGAILPLLFLAPEDPLVARVRQTAYARMELANGIVRDAAILGFVEAKNGAQETMADIQKRDARWRAGGETALRKELTTGACAQRLHALSKDDSFVLEAILMDAQGALVCATHETSDYWQGDEDKWKKPMGGLEAFVDEPAYDESTQSYALQLSVPVQRGGRRIGALTLTLKVPRPAAASAH